MAAQVLRVVEAKRVVTLRFWVVRILPIGLFMALTLHFGNLVYLYLTVAFIQMLKVRVRSNVTNLRPCAPANGGSPGAAGTVQLSIVAGEGGERP